MKLKLLLAVAALVVMVQPAVQAAPSDPIVYSGSIVANSGAGVPVTGATGAFSWLGMNDVPPLDGDLPPVQFWSFFWNFPGTHATITGRRLNTNLDPVFNLYSGLLTAGTTYGAFDPFGSNFGGLTFLANADDEIAAPGPFGDPQFYGILAPGFYTIAIGGFASDCPTGTCPANGYPYSLTIQVPEPTTVPLMLLALGGVAWMVRRQNTGGVSRPA